ncbi:MAG TPA: chitobiase/beta-hexosaminidase C-terminal domain-containing protein [Terracidiphilus sp.]|nr:chitobiase/beta-hexosaminidase C-terminal domain-containing protein [Terracidiphilus sp.]
MATVQVNIGPTQGNCTISGSGTYQVSSTASVTVQAQSTDDLTKTANFLFNVCANSPPTLANGTKSVIVAPAYQQAYQSQLMTLQSWVTGCTDETGTWSIVGQPSGGNGTLLDTTNRDTVFSASVTGRYTIQYSANCNSGTNTAIVYVSPNPMPSFASTPNGTRPHECYVDPALTGPDYEVGPGKAYATISSTPALSGFGPGTILRIWNTDTTGSNPTTYHEYYNVQNSGTPTQPIIICGVADSKGNLPIMDGTNATAQSDVNINPDDGIIILFPAGNQYGLWQNGSAGPSYVSITGLHLRNAKSTLMRYSPGSSSATAWSNFSSCINWRSGSYVDISGNELDNCANGIFSDDNDANAWATITQNLTFIGNHVQMSGDPGDVSGTHQLYVQDYYALAEGNKLDNPSPYAGSQIKWRGVEGIFRYNYLGDGTPRLFDLVDNQDGPDYMSFEYYFSDGQWQTGDTAGANVIAGYQESSQKDFIYGNEMLGTSSEAGIHYAGDQGTPGVLNRCGVLSFYSNTLDNAQIIFDNGFAGNGLNSYFQPRVDARNNIIWANTVAWTGLIQMEFAEFAPIVLDATTNLMRTGTFTITPPILGATWQDGTQEGWPNICDATCPWPLAIPLNTHLYGLNAANYLTTATQPYDGTTFIPPTGSAAIGAGTAITDNPLVHMPVRWQYSVATGGLTPRLFPLTIGAVDQANGTPVVATPTFSPGSGTYSSAQTVTISSSTPGATIYFTTDGSTPTTGSQSYSGPITVSSSETVSAIAVASGYSNSATGSATYVITLGQVATPTFSPVAGTYTSAQVVTISSATPTAIIYYTTDGSTPTMSSPVYSGPITVSSTETLSAIATAGGYTTSSVATAVYTISLTLPAAATPTFSPGAGTYSSSQTVTISSATPSATIYYTTNGSAPTTGSAVYNGPITVSSTETLEAIAMASGYTASTFASAAYTINVPAPDFAVSASPTSLTINAGQTATVMVSVTPLNGFNAPVSLNCAGLPAGVSCIFSPPTVAPMGASASTTLSVITSTTTAALQQDSKPLFPGSVLAIALCFFGWKKRRGLQMLLLLVVSVAGLCLLNGCGGATFATTASRAAVTSTVTVTGTSGALQHTTTFTVTVK